MLLSGDGWGNSTYGFPWRRRSNWYVPFAHYTNARRGNDWYGQATSGAGPNVLGSHYFMAYYRRA